jgi:hypothetical protein
MDATCIGILEATQDPSEKLDYAVDFEDALARYRLANTAYASNVKVRSKLASGFQFSSSGGRTGDKEPRWPTTVGGTIQDGSITWTCEAASTSSLTSTVSSAPFTADTGVTISNQSIVGQAGTAFVAGGLDGQTYNVVCTATMADGRIMVGIVRLTVARKVEC